MHKRIWLAPCRESAPPHTTPAQRTARRSAAGEGFGSGIHDSIQVSMKCVSLCNDNNNNDNDMPRRICLAPCRGSAPPHTTPAPPTARQTAAGEVLGAWGSGSTCERLGVRVWVSCLGIFSPPGFVCVLSAIAGGGAIWGLGFRDKRQGVGFTAWGLGRPETPWA